MIISGIYWTVYLFTTFARWKITNPFSWIVDLPTYDTGERGMGLFAVLMVIAIIFVITYANLEYSNKKQNTDE